MNLNQREVSAMPRRMRENGRMETGREKNGEERTERMAVRTGEIPGFRLVYALYRTGLVTSGGYAYSVTVSISGEYGSETATAADLSRSEEEAQRLFGILADETVTPCALRDVLEELIL